MADVTIPEVLRLVSDYGVAITITAIVIAAATTVLWLLIASLRKYLNSRFIESNAALEYCRRVHPNEMRVPGALRPALQTHPLASVLERGIIRIDSMNVQKSNDIVSATYLARDMTRVSLRAVQDAHLKIMETIGTRGIDAAWSTEAQFKYEMQHFIDNIYGSAHALVESVNIPYSVWSQWATHHQYAYDALRSAVEISASQPDNYSRVHAVFMVMSYHVQRTPPDILQFVSSISVPPYTRYLRTPRTGTAVPSGRLERKN